MVASRDGVACYAAPINVAVVNLTAIIALRETQMKFLLLDTKGRKDGKARPDQVQSSQQPHRHFAILTALSKYLYYVSAIVFCLSRRTRGILVPGLRLVRITYGNQSEATVLPPHGEAKEKGLSAVFPSP